MSKSLDDQAARLDQEFGRILEDSLNEIYIFDARTLKFIQVNRGARENLGYSMAELRELTPVDLKPEFSSDAFAQLVQPLRQSKQQSVCFDTIHQRKDGSQYPVEVHLQLATFHDQAAFIAVILDTSERMHAVQDLRVRNRAIESISVGVVITDAQQPDRPIISCNRAFLEITGYAKEEVLGHNCRFLQQDDRNQEARHVIRTAIEREAECRTLLRNYRKDGRMFWNELTVSPVKNPEGITTHFVGVVNDVTARINAEQASREREARLEAVLNTAVEAIITTDHKGVCESVNQAAETMFGYRAEELVGKNISLLMPQSYRENHDQYIASYLRTGDKKIIGIGREVVGLRKNGEEFPIHLSVSEVQLSERQLFTGIIQDMTDWKESQRRLVQSERLAVLGEALARLAHESRNSLQRIQIAVETARLKCEEGTALVSQLNSIESASDDLDALLNELRNYAAPLHLDKSKTSLAKVWREAWQTTAHSREGRDAKLTEQLNGIDPICHIDRFRLEQVFRNLFDNALAACQDPVRIQLQLSETQIDQHDYWRLHVQDNGPGFNQEQAARVFEPFFTTKAKGTGLGMAIAQRIIEAHGGRIAVATAKQGAVIQIDLPQ